VSTEADLPPVKAAVDKHNTPFDPALRKLRPLVDGQGNLIMEVIGNDQVSEGHS
jgi:hypothetical protein